MGASEARKAVFFSLALVGACPLLAAWAAELGPFLAAHRKAVPLAEAREWAKAAEAYGAFAAAQPNDAGAPLAAFFQGLLLRRDLQKPKEAQEGFQRAAKAPETGGGADVRRAALAWLARLQMEQLDAALRRYWLDAVEYPPSLDALVERKLADAKLLVDPWGKRFAYEPGTLRIAPKMPRQAYTLRCTALDGTSKDFKRLLEQSRTFAAGFKLRATAAGPPAQAVVITPKGDAVTVAEGGQAGGVKVIQIGDDAVILSDGERIAVVERGRPAPPAK
jgi:hypothetical protein